MTIVLHHTLPSPFAELGRIALGYKDLDYRSVMIPNVLPKPDLVALTGGYARTPVLQIGADLYCDTAAIFQALDAHTPDPPLYPAPLGEMHRVLANWAGAAQFIAHIGVAFGSLTPGAVPQGFLDDRKSRFGLDIPQFVTTLPHQASQVMAAATWLNATLADGRPFVGGNAAGHGDLAFYSNLWFVRGRAPDSLTARAIAALPHLAPWYDRVACFGHGRPVEASGADAREVASAAKPDLSEDVDPMSGLASGQTVRVQTADTSRDTPVEGRLLRLSPRTIAVARETDDGGTVVVNFPRLGQLVSCQ